MPDPIDETRRNLAVLDLQPGCSWEEVRDRYRFLAKVWHPDRFGSDAKAISRAETQFKRVNDAYQWLVRHRHLVESLASPHGAAEASGGTDDADSGGSADSPRDDPTSPRNRPKPKAVPRPSREWSLERFLWGVIAAFSLVALTILVASGTLSDMLNGLDPDRPPSTIEGEEIDGRMRTGDGVATVTRFVTASRLNVRSSPERSAPSVATLERGARVRVRPGDGAWLEVVGDGGEVLGWVHGDYVADLRSEPGAARGADLGDLEADPRDMADAFAATVRSGSEPVRTADPSTVSQDDRVAEVGLIRGAWKPVDPDPAARRAREDASSTDDPALEHWTGTVEGPVPSDLPQISVRLYEDPVADRSIGAVVYWRPQGSCTYSLDLLEEDGDWIRTRQVARESGCVSRGEVWFRLGDSVMTGIWHRLDGRRWFTARLGRD